ncbi:hypothetical protein DFH27DRAFT_544746 [Peziza echinospora]|nr:hypothetical protein DFH27DRAFT_544746 [Peziza echinospora]
MIFLHSSFCFFTLLFNVNVVYIMIIMGPGRVGGVFFSRFIFCVFISLFQSYLQFYNVAIVDVIHDHERVYLFIWPWYWCVVAAAVVHVYGVFFFTFLLCFPSLAVFSIARISFYMDPL